MTDEELQTYRRAAYSAAWAAANTAGRAADSAHRAAANTARAASNNININFLLALFP